MNQGMEGLSSSECCLTSRPSSPTRLPELGQPGTPGLPAQKTDPSNSRAGGLGGGQSRNTHRGARRRGALCVSAELPPGRPQAPLIGADEQDV